MSPIRSSVVFSRLRAVAALLALLSSTDAFAAKKVVEDVTSLATFRFYHTSGSYYTFGNITNLYDDVQTSVVGVNTKGDAMVAFFEGELTADEPMMYVDEIRFDLPANTATLNYSLYVSTNFVSSDAQNAVWTPIVKGIATTNSASYEIRERIKAVKFLFETGTKQMSLSEFHLTGYRSSTPKVVSRWQLAWVYKPDGTPMPHESGGWGSNTNYPDCFGGGTHINALFNNNFNDNVYIGPNGRLEDKSYCQLDFSSEATNGWFVTEIMTGSLTTNQYSLYYSMDGTTWLPVEDGTNVCSIGKRRFNVYDLAVYVKCVFDDVGGWTPAFNELQVWGMNPDDVACEHPSYTEWVFDDSLTDCLLFPVDKRHCTVCGAAFTREEFWEPPPGHNYVVALERPGAYKDFGRGHISCARCDFFLDCPAPIDLITNRVNGTQIGDIKADGFIRFTDVSASSTGNTDWGVNPDDMIDNDWTWAWNHYWYSDNDEDHPDLDPHVDCEFGTDIDLVYIDVSLPNSTHFTRFFSVDDATGEETQLKRFLITRTDPENADKYHIWADPEVDEWENIYVDPRSGEFLEFDQLPVVRDGWIPSRKHDADGNEIQDNPNTDGDDGDNSYNSYQRFTVRFFEQPIRHLRIRQYTADGSVMIPMFVSELHPCGTVKGAGDLRYRKETIMILR